MCSEMRFVRKSEYQNKGAQTKTTIHGGFTCFVLVVRKLNTNRLKTVRKAADFPIYLFSARRRCDL